MNSSHTFKRHPSSSPAPSPSSSSVYQPEYDMPYNSYHQRPPASSAANLWVQTTSTKAFLDRGPLSPRHSHEEPLHQIMGNPRIRKASVQTQSHFYPQSHQELLHHHPHSQHQQQQHQQHQPNIQSCYDHYPSDGRNLHHQQQPQQQQQPRQYDPHFRSFGPSSTTSEFSPAMTMSRSSIASTEKSLTSNVSRSHTHLHHGQFNTRHNTRPPSLFDRIKAALDTPRRVSTSSMDSTPSFAPMIPSEQHHQHSSSSEHASPYPASGQRQASVSMQEDVKENPHPTLYGIRCTEVSQRAYSGQSSQMKSSFDRLQKLDQGKVEYRTIAFCTHLTVSRWEPTATPAPAGSTTDDERSQDQGPQPQQETSDQQLQDGAKPQKDPVQAARLMSLANYIRHILTLTVSPPRSIDSSQAPMEQHLQKQQQSKEDRSKKEVAHGPSQHSGPGPIKSETSRRHRYSPEYHNHAARRSHHHQQEHRRQEDLSGPHPLEHNIIVSQQNTQPPPPSSPTTMDHSNHPQHYYNQQRMAHGPSGISVQHSQFTPQLQHHRDEGFFSTSVPRNTSRQHSLSLSSPLQPLLKIPYPNLTLTLALIYVDRLKAKYPEAKGEPGCSHRLFLVAYIIAAKYRCSVELSKADPPHCPNGEITPPPQENPAEFDGMSLESRLHAELIFSNHAWVRLLNLGSFQARPVLSSTSPNGGQILPIHARSSVTTPMLDSTVSSPSLPPLASPSLSISTTTTSSMSVDAQSPMTPTQNSSGVTVQLPSVSTILPHHHQHHQQQQQPAPSTLLQVEDLDRMEAEFLTFLNFDLATLDHDLETCWNLLVGKYINT
ncbi:hypothetical protein EMPS_04586 [Entomortierella parvispora]|uniref:Cyclin N-terminal domain-containing protein n=1 Tax=Entomortierella parvispora TaxID=205924 RepID=A0A9P3H8X4_9FUNG|nr:hypothetical protein EMPS_04586 [Entomortierella parvispora]